ncbi:MAG: substrate-binding domain-containing protein [Ruminiclostridium sp.]
MTVGIISTYLDDYIFPSIIRGVEGVLSANGYAVQLASSNDSVEVEARSLQLMMERRVDGLIVVPTKSALPCVNLDLYNTIKQSGIPIVFINSSYPELSIPYVALDDVKAGYIATQYLLSMGHTNIAGIFPHIKRQGHLRYSGYVKALAGQGIPFQDDRVFWYSNENFLQRMKEDLLWESLSTCSAALCFNDQMALSLIDFVRQKGFSVPENFSVVGIDDSELAKISSLTSVVHPSEQLGDAAAKLLLSMINGYEGKNILFPPQLQIRGSVGKLEVLDMTKYQQEV